MQSVFDSAVEDVRVNLWILGDVGRNRIIGWFSAISQEAYKRGRDDMKKEINDNNG